MTPFNALIYRLHVQRELKLNQTTRCKTGLFLLLQKSSVSNALTASPSRFFLPWGDRPLALMESVPML